MTNNWPVNEPDSLEDLCIKQCVSNIQTIAEKTGSYPDLYKLKPEVYLLVPSVCDKLFQTFQESQPLTDASWDWIGIFDEPESTRLCNISLFRALHEFQTENPARLLEICLKHPLKQLEFIDCPFSCAIFNLINTSRANNSLLSLCFEGPNFVDDALKAHFTLERAQKGDNFIELKLDCPKLHRLVLRDVKQHDLGMSQYCDFVHLFPQLTHLDLSRSNLSHYGILSLGICENLIWLNLNCIEFQSHADLITSICRIIKLRHLDISSDNNLLQSTYPHTELNLKSLVLHLPKLVSLDISGTNLAGQDITVISHRPEAKSAGDTCSEEDVKKELCTIPGLEGRYFEFLGLYNCPYESYNRENIPAKQVTGSKNEEQLLLALRRYVDRQDDINDILNQLFILFKDETVINQATALEGILAAMKRFPNNKHIQISGSASLFYIMKGEQKYNVTQKQKRILINCLLDGMEDPEADIVMIRNCCLTLCHLSMPQDVLYCYGRMISILLSLNQEDGQENFIQRITLYMINHLACQVDGEEKKVVGDLGAIKIMLKTIQRKLNEGVCDEIMEMAWSTMWNVTDETAINCDRFMDDEGMALFIECLEAFPEKPELLRNMMGLMGNIAEVPHLRPRLMEEAFIRIFCDLLDSEKDGIEVSYNSAGVFSHMMADGEAAWTVEKPTRSEVTERVISAIQRWPLKSTRNINYRSFIPILKLVDKYDALGAQYWSVWALCNLTTVYPQKYCCLLRKEGGYDCLSKITQNPDTHLDIKNLAMKILNNMTKDPEETDELLSNSDIDSDSDGD